MYRDIIHDEYKKEYSKCPFWNEKLKATTSKNIDCSEQPNLTTLILYEQPMSLWIFRKIGIEWERNRSITRNIMLRIFLIHYVKSMVSKLVMWIGKGYITYSNWLIKYYHRLMATENEDKY